MLFHSFFVTGYSQDLILNGDFDDINICTEYEASCSPEAWRLTSTLAPGYSETGDNRYTSFVIFNSSKKNIRSYLLSRLADCLVMGNRYKLILDISPDGMIINNIGVVFSDTIILSKSNKQLDLKTDIVFENNRKLLKPGRKKDWLRLEKEFVAEENANFIIIGCFLPDTELISKYSRAAYKPFKDYHYRVDNISLVPLGHSHDTSLIKQTEAEIYSQDLRHPVPDELFDIPGLLIDTEEKVHQASISDTIILFDDLLFGFDSHKPSMYLIHKIDSVFDNITLSIDSILISGHTDNVGTDEYNDELSLKRAKSVSDYIISRDIVAEDKIHFQGKGSGFPIASNASDMGRYKNRRVEVIIKYKISR